MDIQKTEEHIIDTYLKVPFKVGGRSIEGCDCWGIVTIIYKDIFNIDLIDFEGSQNYDEKWFLKGENYLLEYYYKQWEVIDKKDIKPFDMVFFNNSRGIANHIGVVLTKNKFIHCSKAGTIISKLTDNEWSKRIENFYSLKALKK